MPRTTLAQAKESRIAASIGMCPDDPRFLQILNESQQRLLQKGLWYGTTAHYSICTHDSCLTWPRQFAAIESIWVCGSPLTLRGEWFEYLQSGFGLQGGCNGGGCDIPNWSGWNWLCGGGNALFRQNACTFADIVGLNKKIKVYCDVEEADGAKILLQGYDENRNWIRTEVDGEWVDGEYVLLISGTPQTTVNFFSSLTGVQKPDTNGNVRLYELNTDDSTQRAIAVYEPDETVPDYRRSYIPGMCGQCVNSDNTCPDKPVGVIAKLAFIPAKKDEDYLIIGNLPALKFECQAVQKQELAVSSPDVAESIAFEALAIKELQNELAHFRGKSIVQPLRMPPRSVFGAGILNMQ